MFRKLKLSPGLMLIISVIMLIINYLLSGVFKTDSETVNALIGNIIYVDDDSIFPLFSWSVFPVFGYFAKKVFENKDDKKATSILFCSFAVSIVIFATAAILLNAFGYDVFKIIVSPLNDYKTDMINVVLLLCLNTVFIGIVFFMINTICKSKIFLSVSLLSKNILPFFTVHWLVVTVVCYVIAVFYTLRETFISIPIMLATAFCITVASLLITKKMGYKIVKFMLKTVTLNGLLKF
ncbi:MAG: hypothetical protein KBS59_06810 [Clostridiales bacterium]|nr:hypothetical protein [Clostridiales bacterium]